MFSIAAAPYYHFISPQAVYENSSFSISSPIFVIFVIIFTTSHLNGYKVLSLLSDIQYIYPFLFFPKTSPLWVLILPLHSLELATQGVAYGTPE